MNGLSPGSLVRHPERPDWGPGQVQSIVGQRATVNFENAGKLLIQLGAVTLVEIDADEAARMQREAHETPADQAPSR